MARELQMCHSMKWMVGVLLVGMLIVFPALALCDLVRPPCDLPLAPAPLSAGALFELMFGTIVENGVSLLLVGSVAVVGVPWMIAGLGLALLSLPGRLKTRT